jgi:hypothetical protein
MCAKRTSTLPAGHPGQVTEHPLIKGHFRDYFRIAGDTGGISQTDLQSFFRCFRYTSYNFTVT